MRSLVLLVTASCSYADFILSQNFTGNGCSGAVYITDAITDCFPASGPGPVRSESLTCVNASAATRSTYASPDCSGRATGSNLPFAFSNWGCVTGFPVSALTTCVDGTFAPPRGAVVTMYHANECPAAGLTSSIAVYATGVCVPFDASQSRMYTCDPVSGLSVMVYPPGCPKGQGQRGGGLPIGCSVSNSTGDGASVVACG